MGLIGFESTRAPHLTGCDVYGEIPEARNSINLAKLYDPNLPRITKRLHCVCKLTRA